MAAQHDKGKNWVDGKSVRQVAETDGTYSEPVAAELYAWDATAGAYVKLTVDHATGNLNVTGGGGGGGGAVTIADGADVAQGTTTDLSSANTVVGLLKAIKAAVQGTLTTARSWTLSSGTDSVNVGNFPATQPVSGTVTVQQATAANLNATVSGTVTANAGTNLNTSALALDATLTGGTQKAIARGGAKGATAAADITSNPIDVNTQALHVDGSKVTQPVSGSVSVSNFPATQPVSGTVTADTELPAASALADAEANPTVPRIGGMCMVWNGTTWDRAPGTAAAGLKVQSAQLPAALVGGRLSVDASGVAVPVTDNAGSLTVDSAQLPAALAASGGIKVDLAGTGANATAVKVDGSAVTQPVSGTFWQATQPVSGTVTANQGTANVTPWNENLAQVGGAAVSLGQKISANAIPTVPASDWLTEAVPSGGFGNPALRVFTQSIRKATYQVMARNQTSGALVANTSKPVVSMEHAAVSTKTVRIRRVWAEAIVSTAGGAAITDISLQITRGTAASSAGAAITPSLANAAQAAADTTCKSLPTITAATIVATYVLLYTPAAGATAGTTLPRTLVYDWSDAGSVEPITIRPSVLESLVFNLLSSNTPTLTYSLEIEFTEE